ncbi:unnamed protein product [[Candida] boidinii]|nr:unnamed protein product [[Candida] boidinii]
MYNYNNFNSVTDSLITPSSCSIHINNEPIPDLIQDDEDNFSDSDSDMDEEITSTTTTGTATATITASAATQPDLERGNLMNLLINIISDKILEKYYNFSKLSINKIANNELINLKQDLIYFIRLLLSRSKLSLKNFEKSILYLNRFNLLINNNNNEIKNLNELKLIIVYSFILSCDNSSNDIDIKIKNWSIITGLNLNLLINGYNKFYTKLNEFNLILINQNDLSNLNNSLKLEIRKLIKFL